MKLKPLGDRLIVKAVEEDETTASGIVLPDTAKEKPQKGKVLVAVGAMKLWVEPQELHVAARPEPVEERVVRPPSVDMNPGRSSDNTIDLRGLRADDALAIEKNKGAVAAQRAQVGGGGTGLSRRGEELIARRE